MPAIPLQAFHSPIPVEYKKRFYKSFHPGCNTQTYKIASYIPLEWKNGKLEKVLLASMDVTQEKKAEIESRQALKEAYWSAENANRAKTEFLSNMSHDIRTPMNAIVGLTAIAGANIESQDRVIECLSKITKSSRHLLGLINEVLDMARIESGKMTLAQEDFNLPDLVDNLITLTKPVLDEHKHNLDIHINPRFCECYKIIHQIWQIEILLCQRHSSTFRVIFALEPF